MNPSVKKWVKWMRIVQLVLRCFEILCAMGLLVLMILIKGVDVTAGWIMRIVVSFSPACDSVRALKHRSLPSQSCTHSTASITWEGSPPEEHPLLLPPTCSSHPSSMSPLCPSMPSLHWSPRPRIADGQHFSPTKHLRQISRRQFSTSQLLEAVYTSSLWVFPSTLQSHSTKLPNCLQT